MSELSMKQPLILADDHALRHATAHPVLLRQRDLSRFYHDSFAHLRHVQVYPSPEGPHDGCTSVHQQVVEEGKYVYN